MLLYIYIYIYELHVTDRLVSLMWTSTSEAFPRAPTIRPRASACARGSDAENWPQSTAAPGSSIRRNIRFGRKGRKGRKV